MTSAASRYDAVVFDNDGVLTHPTDQTVLRIATEAALRALGVTPTSEEVDALTGDVSTRSIRRVAARYNINPERLWSRSEAERAAAQLTAVRAGRKPLYDDVSVIDRLEVPLAIVSNNQQATVDGIVDAFGLSGFVSHLGREPTLDGYRRRKPDPSYLETVLDRLGTRSVLYVGDSRVDVVAAAAAGVDSAYVRRPHRSAGYPDVEPTYRLDGLGQLLALPVQGETA
jgi:HAD superfamily hydrolase (TIGR01549 family)